MSTQTEFAEFDRDLKKIEASIRFVIEFRGFGAESPDSVDDPSAFIRAALELHKVSDSIRTDLPIMVGSLVLYACGRFEYFVGELVKAVADREVAKADSYADLPNDVRDSLRARILAILNEPARYSHLKLSDQQLASTLSRIVLADQNEAPSDIPTEILASTDANMRPQMLKDVFARVGIKDLWSEISKQAPLRTHFETASEHACKSAATNFLEDLMRLRNSIAHPTASLSFPSPERVLEICGSLRALSRAIGDVAYLPR